MDACRDALDTNAIVLYEMGAYDDCDKNATVGTF